jgi:hypothetical protein
MKLTIKDIYSIKCAIGRTLFFGRTDWSERIELDSDNYSGKEGDYLRFKTNDINVSLCSDNTVHICAVGGRKAVKFKHDNIVDTIDRITAELKAHRDGET